MRNKYLIFAALVILAAVLTQIAFSRGKLRGNSDRSELPKLATDLPLRVQGWVGRDEPLGSTESVLQQTITTLNFDDSVYRIYSKGGDWLGIYIAYWRPGKMSVRDVESHVPDICWRLAGWTMTEKVPEAKWDVGREGRISCEYRVFQAANQVSHVVYWHVVDGRVVENYGVEEIVPWWAPLRDMFRFGLSISGEQYFVRVHSNRDLSELRKDPAVADLIQTAARISGGAQKL